MRAAKVATSVVAALAICLTGVLYAHAYQAEGTVGDIEDTPVSNPTIGDLDVTGDMSVPIGNKYILDGPSGTSYITAYSGAENVRVYRAGTLHLDINGASTAFYAGSDGRMVVSPQSSTAETPAYLRLYRWDDTPTATAVVGMFELTSKDSGGSVHIYGAVKSVISDPTAGAEYADMVFESTTNGIDATEYMRYDSSAGAVVLSAPIVVPTYTRSKDMSAGSAGVGPTAPTWSVQDTLAGLQFDAAAEKVGWTVEIDDCWDGISDMEWKLYVTTEAGDVIADTEVVEFDCTYRALADGEASDNGAAVTINPSYTQSGAGTDSSRHKLEALLDYDSANQPLAAGDMIHMLCNRDVGASDTYSGFVILEQAELEFECTTIASH